jgi:hypothetical protein
MLTFEEIAMGVGKYRQKFRDFPLMTDQAGNVVRRLWT